MRRIAAVLSVVSLAILPAIARADTTYPGVVQQRDVRITMSDGAKLAADVIRPADASGAIVPGRFPVVLTQTPYNKAATGLNFRSDFLVQHGYIQVIADVRGTGGSQGQWDSFGTREQLDGAELVTWATQQSWSTGDVALHGTSYGAINQLFTAAQRPAGLKAIFPIVPMGDAYRDITVTGGQFNTAFIPSWLGLVTAGALLPPTYAADDPVGAATAVAGHAGGAAGFQASTVTRGTAGDDEIYDGPFYRQRSPIEVIDRINVPTFVVGGWYDLFQRSEPVLYQHLAANGVPSKLLMGPWYHTQVGLSSGLPADGVPALDQLELRWFDHYVKGAADANLDAMAPVTYYRLGEGHYRTASSWPPAGIHHAPLYLAGNGTQGGALRSTPPAADASDSLIAVAASGICSRSFAQWTASGVHQGCEENQIANDAMGLRYDLPITTDMTMAGPIGVHLYESSLNGQDAALTVRLEDVSPDGRTSTQITAGWSLVSMRALDMARSVLDEHGDIVKPFHPFTRESVLATPAGEIDDIWIEVFPTAAVVKAGHTLRLAIQQSDTPHQTPAAPEAARLAGNVLSIYHDAEHPSAIVLPLQS